MLDLYPSKRPKVSQATWRTVFTEEMEYDRKGLYGGVVVVQLGDPYPDYYRVISYMGKPVTKTSKLFFGESAYFAMCRYVGDLGFPRIYSASIY